MANVTIPGLTTLTSIDRAADLFEVSDTSDGGNSKKTTVNSMLNITSQPLELTGAQSPTNKTFDNTNIFTIRDDRLTLQDNSDTTKQAVFQLSSITTGTTRTYTLPNASSTLVDLTSSQTLSNKTLTSPTISAPTITNPTVTVDTISEFTSGNGVTIDGLNIKDNKLNTNNSVVTNNITDSAVTSAKVAEGFPVQIVSTNYSAVATGTTIIPYDNTIPQITEGTEFMTQAITPKSATNRLSIEVNFSCDSSVTADTIIALFQDTTVNALAANSTYTTTANGESILTLRYDMVAGTTSSTTFRVRGGLSTAGTFTFNGFSGAARFGGVTMSNIKITEYKA